MTIKPNWQYLIKLANIKFGEWQKCVSNELATSNGSHNFEEILNEDVTHVLHVTHLKMSSSWPTHVKDFFKSCKTYIFSFIPKNNGWNINNQ
jgi:hypothetical protein